MKPIPLDLVSPKQAANILGVTISTVYRWIYKRTVTRYGGPGTPRLSLAECANPRKPTIVVYRKYRKRPPDLYATDADRVGL